MIKIARCLTLGLGTMVMILSVNTKVIAESHVLVDNKPFVLSNRYAGNEVGGQSAFMADSDANSRYVITVVSEGNGRVNPAGIINARQGEVKSFAFLPAAGYHISAIRVDGELFETVDSFTFINVRADHALEVVFAENNEPPLAFVVSK